MNGSKFSSLMRGPLRNVRGCHWRYARTKAVLRRRLRGSVSAPGQARELSELHRE